MPILFINRRNLIKFFPAGEQARISGLLSKVKNGYAMIYDEDGKFTQKSISLGKNDELNGYNGKYGLSVRCVQD